MSSLGSPLEGGTVSSPPSLFKYVIGASCLFIAGCSAYFSVRGLGMLFVGAATAVMVLAASLELGKLVTASFLYRYWHQLAVPMRFYLTTAVVVLIAVTSLGIYGYLARAYERTNTRIRAYEEQIASVEKEIADVQARIDSSRGALGQASAFKRDDLDQAQQRLTQINQSFDQSLARLQERRQLIQSQRDQDLAVPRERLAAATSVFQAAMASENDVIAGLNDQLAVLDRAVDAYTAQGGPGLFKADGIKRGHDLREQQRSQRAQINAAITTHRDRQAQLQQDYARRTDALNTEVGAIQTRSGEQLARLDEEETRLRETHATTVAQTEQQLAGLQAGGETIRTTGQAEIEAMFQRIRAGQEEIRHLQAQIAATDIGSYRFVARAFEAPADDVVKWLMLALVAVIDPLAVTLAVGFNMALLTEIGGDRRRRHAASAVTPRFEMAGEATGNGNGSRRPRSPLVVAGSLVLALLLGGGLIVLAVQLINHQIRDRRQTAHSQLVPADSFVVASMDPPALARAGQTDRVLSWLTPITGPVVTELSTQLNDRGFDQRSRVFAFAKYPQRRADQPTDRPVMIAGLILRVTDPAAAEEALAGLADQLNRRLRASDTTLASLTRNRAMVRYGRGRYMDPEGGFFTFAVCEDAALVLIEIEGDPAAPCVEAEMQQCLALPDPDNFGGSQALDTPQTIPAEIRAATDALALWFDSQRYFAALPKNAAAQARYQQLQRHLDFGLRLNVNARSSGQLEVAAKYVYGVERFKTDRGPTALETVAALGPATDAGLPGQLMDRCADTLDYDSLIGRLRTVLGETDQAAVEQVVVEKSIESTRAARFQLTAQFDAPPENPVTAALGGFAR